jgi:hypothetical protein
MTEEETLWFRRGIESWWCNRRYGYHTWLPRTSLDKDADDYDQLERAWERGCCRAEGIARYVPYGTPDWIYDFLATTPHGGWIHPIELTPDHPLVTGLPISRVCPCCEEGFAETKGKDRFAIIMPMHDAYDSWWIAYHRTCVMKMIGLEPDTELDETLPG